MAVCLVLPVCAAPAELLREGLFRIEYPKGEERLAAITLKNLEDVLADWGKYLDAGEQPVMVHICASPGEFASRAGFSPPAEVGGVAHSEDGIIVLRTPNQLPNPKYYEGVVRHELIHVLLARNTDLTHLPRWLNEGIAMHISGEYRWNSTFHVARMYMADRLYSYDDLMLHFHISQRERPFGDLYAQSLSMTAYLYDSLGEEAFWDMVYALREKDFPEALGDAAEMTPEEFWDAWYNSLWKIAVISTVVSGFGVFHLMALLLIVAYMRKRRRNRTVMKRWEHEEAEEEPFMTVWDLERESEYPWERDDEEQI
ncbi:MAG: hypothetical protein R6V12_00685 [Candidatus Hydrogenedentota bacterium]